MHVGLGMNLSAGADRERGIRMSRFAAVAITAIIHALLLTLLLLAGRPTRNNEQTQVAERLRLRWVARTISSAPVIRSDQARQTVQVPRHTPVPETRSVSSRSENDLERPNPSVRSSPSESMSLDLDVKEDPLVGFDFSKPIAGRPNPDVLEKPPVLILHMQDRSLGGMLGGMTRASTCAELRRAAAEASKAGGDGQLGVIAESMRRYGCN